MKTEIRHWIFSVTVSISRLYRGIEAVDIAVSETESTSFENLFKPRRKANNFFFITFRDIYLYIYITVFRSDLFHLF